MAPQKLTDAALESILWNKVPLKLQREVKEITDGSIQELLQKLLRAESVVNEGQHQNPAVGKIMGPRTKKFSNRNRSLLSNLLYQRLIQNLS